MDSTCIDILIRCRTPAQTKNFHAALLKSLFERDLKITRHAFNTIKMRYSEGALTSPMIPFESFASPLLDNSELLEAIVSKSDHQLRSILDQPRNLQALDFDMVVYALTMATMTGWTHGCRAMVDAHLLTYLDDESENRWRFSCPLIVLSASTNRPDMMQFWLSQRTRFNGPQLIAIGHVEDLLYYADLTFSMDTVCLLHTHLANERREIRLLMEKHGVEYCCEGARKSLPDAHVECMLTALVSEGVAVSEHYWPRQGSVYNSRRRWTAANLEMLESLEKVGFCDISQEKFECSRGRACSPLMYLAKQDILGTESGCLTQRDLIVRWFLSKGADLKETWPGTDTTVLHCLAWQSAAQLQCRRTIARSNESPAIETCWAYEGFEFLVKNEVIDGCECGCSGAGCDFLSCFWNELFGRWYEYYGHGNFYTSCESFDNAILARNCRRLQRHDNSQMLLEVTLWVDKVADTLGHSRLVSGYIRLFVFSYLEIRHTCCDTVRICRDEDPNQTEQPYPRYSPKELRRITKEDAYLRARLEELVPELISQYDSFRGQLQDFVIDVLIPTMRRTAKELKEEDEALYAAGRRELGVIMNEDGDETEGESIEVEEEETDTEEESDDEY